MKISTACGNSFLICSAPCQSISSTTSSPRDQPLLDRLRARCRRGCRAPAAHSKKSPRVDHGAEGGLVDEAVFAAVLLLAARRARGVRDRDRQVRIELQQRLDQAGLAGAAGRGDDEEVAGVVHRRSSLSAARWRFGDPRRPVVRDLVAGHAVSLGWRRFRRTLGYGGRPGDHFKPHHARRLRPRPHRPPPHRRQQPLARPGARVHGRCHQRWRLPRGAAVHVAHDRHRLVDGRQPGARRHRDGAQWHRRAALVRRRRGLLGRDGELRPSTPIEQRVRLSAAARVCAAAVLRPARLRSCRRSRACSCH